MLAEEECSDGCLKLSVVRSFFEYLKAAGAVPLNPASTKLVSPPQLQAVPVRRQTRVALARGQGKFVENLFGIAFERNNHSTSSRFIIFVATRPAA